MTDEELIRRFAERGDQDAFAQVVHRHFHWVYSTALRLTRGDHALADDVSQSVFILLARKANSLCRGGVLINWLFSAAYFCHRSAIRGELRLRKREQRAAHLRSEIVQPSPAVWETLAPILDESIQRLGTADRRVILLRYYQGRSYSEISDEMRISEDAARKRISRAVEQLRNLFAQRGVKVEGAALGAVLAANVTHPAPAGAAASAAAMGNNIVASAAQTIARHASRKMLLSQLIPLVAAFSIAAVVVATLLFLRSWQSPGPATVVFSTTLPATATTQPATPFTGRVISPQGAPVPNARVILIDRAQTDALVFRPYAQVVSDAQGRYTINHPGNLIDVLAQADGYAISGARRVNGVDNDIKLRQPMSLRMKLVGPQGQPAAGVGATVRIIRDSRARWEVPLLDEMKRSLTRRSDEQGICLLSDLPRDAIISLEIADDRLFAKDRFNQALRIATGPDATLDIGTINLSLGAVISGRVIDAQTRKPVAGMRVFSDKWISVVTDAQGNYRLPQVMDPKSLRVDLTSTEPDLPSYTSAIPSRQPIVNPGEELTGVDWQLVRGESVRAAISGRGTARGQDQPATVAPRRVDPSPVGSFRIQVCDEQGVPITHAMIMHGTGNTTRADDMMVTGAEGTCVFDVFNTEPGQTLMVAADGYAVRRVPCVVELGKQIDLVIPMQRLTRQGQPPPPNLPR